MKTRIVSFILITSAFTSILSARTVSSNASADFVLGQSDFDESQPGSTASELDSPSGIAIDPTTGKVFVADSNNNRVLRFASITTLQSGAAAEAVLGQNGFASPPVAATSSRGMDYPAAVFVDHLGRLWVADRDNARVLRFSSASTIASYSAADRVYGQADFDSNTFAVTSSGMINPRGVWVDTADRLWVCDEASCRVLRFDNISSKPNGAAANGVLGQADFTMGSQGSGATGLERPMSIAISASGALFVACERGHRVLRFDRAATLSNGAAASAAFGQSNLTDATSGLSATKFNTPTGLGIGKDDSLWVCDQVNNRVLRFDRASTRSSGAAADAVLGQADFTSNAVDITANSLYYPSSGIAVDGFGRPYVTDLLNNRVLRYPATASRPVLNLSKAAPKTTKKKTVSITGTASDPNSITEVRYRVGSGVWKRAVGSTSWRFSQRLAKGKNKITIVAFDVWGDSSQPRVVRISRK